MTAVEFLRGHEDGGWYTPSQIAAATVQTVPKVIDQLDAAARSGDVERREFRCARVISNGGRPREKFERTAMQTLEQWRTAA